MPSLEAISSALLKVVPPIMRTIKKKWKNGPIFGVTNSQFHILRFVKNNPGAALQDVAQHLAQTSPSTSAAVDELVLKQLVSRVPSTEDRRRITLTLTEHGQKILIEISENSQRDLEPFLLPLSVEERQLVLQALNLLEPLFSTSRELSEIHYSQ